MPYLIRVFWYYATERNSFKNVAPNISERDATVERVIHLE